MTKLKTKIETLAVNAEAHMQVVPEFGPSQVIALDTCFGSR